MTPSSRTQPSAPQPDGIAPPAPSQEQSVHWLTPEEQRAWRTFWYTTSRIHEQLSRALETRPGVNLTLAEYEILVRLSEGENKRARMSELAEHVLHSRSRLTHTVARLEKRGLVTRERCREDRRGREAVLTPQGLALIETAAPVHVQSVRDQLVDVIGGHRLLTLADILTELLDEDERAEINSIGADRA